MGAENGDKGAAVGRFADLRESPFWRRDSSSSLLCMGRTDGSALFDAVMT